MAEISDAASLAADTAAALASGEFYLAILPEPEEVSCFLDTDPDDFLHEISGSVVLMSCYSEILATIGRFRAFQVDVEGALSQRVSVFDVFDTLAGTVGYYELYDGFHGFLPGVLKAIDCEDEWLASNLLILDRIEIDPPFRGKRYGLKALRCVIQQYRIGVGLVVMKPYPLQFEGELGREERSERGLAGFKGSFTRCRAQLRRYYAQLGFKHIPRTEYMALAPIAPLPQFEPNDK